MVALVWTLFVGAHAYQLNYETSTGTYSALHFTRSALSWGLRRALTTAPKGIGLFLLDSLIVLGMAGPGNLIRNRVFRLQVDSMPECLLIDIALGLMAYVPVVLAVGTYIGLSAGIMGTMTTVFLSPSVLVLRRVTEWPRYRNDVWTWVRQHVRRATVPTLPLGLLLVVTLYFPLLGSLGPVVDWDAQAYHLAAPKHYVEIGHFYNIIAATHDPYLDLNPYQEITYTPFFAMLGVHAAKLIGWFDATITCAAMILFTRKHFASTRTGLFAALTYLSIPLIFWDANSGYNDIAMGAFSFLSFYAIWAWVERSSEWNWAYLAMAFAGFSLGIKEFGLITLVVIAATLVARSFWSRRRDKVRGHLVALRIIIAGLAAVVTCLPWWIRAAATTGDPIFPAGTAIFPTPYWNQKQGAVLLAQDTTTHNSWLSLLSGLPHSIWLHAVDPVGSPPATDEIVGPFFLVAIPVGVLLILITRGRPHPVVIFGSLFSVAWLCGWWIADSISARYLIGVAPVACVIIAGIVKHAWGRPRFTTSAVSVLAGILVCVGISGMQLFGGFLKEGGTGAGVGIVTFQIDYLYGSATDFDVAGRWFPIISYINSHFSAKGTKMYDDAGEVQGYLFLNAEIFNGVQAGSPPDMGQWTLYSPRAYSDMRQQHVTLLAAPAADSAALGRAPLGEHLSLVFSAESIDLYRLVPS